MDEQDMDNPEDQEKLAGTPPSSGEPEGEMEQVVEAGTVDQGRVQATRAGIITGVVLALIAALAIILVWDPFNMHLLERLSGRYDAAMAAMPPDTKFYIGFDLRNLSPDKLDRVIKPFASKVEEAEVQNYEEMLEQIDDGLERDLGITLTDDIIPWIGQYIGIGVVELDMQGIDLFGYSSSEPEAHFIVAVEARDRGAADEFLEKVGDYWTRENDIQSQTMEHGGVTITYWPAGNQSQMLAFTRVKGIVLIGQFAEDVEQAIDAFQGESLADDPAYHDLIGDLHKDRGLTVFTTGAAMESIYGEMPSFELAASQFDLMQGYAMTLTVVDAGLQLDIVARIDDAKYSEEFGKPYPISSTPLTAPENVPADSVIYLGGFSMDDFWENYQTSLERSGAAEDVNESIQLLSDEIGLDLNDFFTALDGVFTLSVLPKDLDTGENPYSVLFPFDVLLTVGTSQQGEVLEMLEPLASSLSEALMIDLNPVKRGDFTIYDVADPSMDISVFIFGVGKDHLILSTSSDVLDRAFGGGPSLTTSEVYQAAAEALPDAMDPFLFVDSRGLTGMINDIEDWMGSMEAAEQISQPLDALISVSVGVKVQPGPVVKVTAIGILEQPQ